LNEGRTASCVGPGEAAFFGDITLVPGELQVDAIATIEYAISGLSLDIERHPLAPTLVSSEVLADGRVVAGVLRNDASAAIHRIRMEVYPIQVDGLTFDHMSMSRSEPLQPGESWNFETRSYDDGLIADYQIFIDFEAFSPAEGG